MSDIVGKKFTIITKEPTTDLYRTRTVLIEDQFYEDGQRMYRVRERGRPPFAAIADIYDQYFKIRKGEIRPKGYKGASLGGPGVRLSEY